MVLNFYKHHLGDYDGATAHLSWDEDMAYTRLLRIYYRLEKPLPVAMTEVYRLARATTKVQKVTVERVLREFFTEHADGWHNCRCDEEIAAYHDTEEDRETRRENERDRQRRHREQRKGLFESLRGHGVVPRFDTQTDALQTLLSRVTHGDGNGIETCDATANQNPEPEPDTRKQKELKTTTEGSSEPKPVTRDRRVTAEPTPAEIEIMLPTNNGKEFPVLKAKMQEWTITYPAVDVTRTLLEIRQWCMDNPTRRKTAHGMHAFVGRWMAREQNRGR